MPIVPTMTSRGFRGVSLACALPLLALTTGCPTDDLPSIPGNTTEDGTTTSTLTTTMTPVTTQTASSGDPDTDSTTDGETTVSVDDTGTSTTGDPTGDPPGTSSSSGEPPATSSSSGDMSSSSGPPPMGCGNGMIDMGEDCDSDDVGAATCADQGFDGGVLGCNNNACTFDQTGCFFSEALQNDNGMCDFQELGCSDDLGDGGNPQDLLECFTSTLTPPIDVSDVQYAIGDSVPLPTALDLVIYDWAGPGNLPGALIDTIPLDPMVDIVAGLYTFTLATPVNVATNTFCVGFSGTDITDGFRVDFTDVDNVGESYVIATDCGIAAFTEATAIGFAGNFCIRPTVTSPNP